MSKKLFQFGNYTARFRKRKQQQLKTLSDIHVTYLTQKPFPEAGAGARQAVRLCLADAGIGTAILMAILFFLDLFYDLLGTPWVYVLLFAVIFGIFALLNWKRYGAHCRALAEKEREHEV